MNDTEPDAAPELVAAAVGAGAWRRLDPRMLAIRPVHALIRVALPIAVVLVGGGGSHQQWIGLGIAGLIVLGGVTQWFTTRYRIGATHVELRSGLLRRRVMAVPVGRIRSVDVTASLLYRVLGLAVVKVGSGRQDKGKRDELRLDGVTAAEAHALRGELLHQRAMIAASLEGSVDGPALAARADEAAVPQEPIETVLVRLDKRWIRYAPFTLSGLVTAGAIVGFAFQLVNETHVDLERLAPTRAAASAVRHNPIAVNVLAAVAILVVLVTVLSTVGYVLAFWNFTLARHSHGTLRTQRGLLTTRSVTLEEARLRGVEVSEPLLLRAVGGARCLAIATGLRVGRGAERGGELLLPPAPVVRAHEVAALVLAEPDPTLAPLRPHGPVARRRRFTRALGGAALIVALAVGLHLVAGAPSWLWQVALVLFPLGALLAADRARSLSHGLTDRYLVTRYGSLDRRTSALRRDGIIGWRIRQSYFQRRSGVATLIATTAGGRGAYRTLDVPVGQAYALAATAVPELLTPFLR